jgi:hypothetical protein
MFRPKRFLVNKLFKKKKNLTRKVRKSKFFNIALMFVYINKQFNYNIH